MNQARLLAEHLHRNQQYDIFPYMKHISDVVDVVEHLYSATFFEYGQTVDSFFVARKDKVISVAYLHDAIEDGHVSYNDLYRHFGTEVAEGVYAVTDELGRNRSERKVKTYEKINKDPIAKLVKLADRIANAKNSKLHQPRLFDLYLREYSDFRRTLYVKGEYELLDVAWAELDKLFKTEI